MYIGVSRQTGRGARYGFLLKNIQVTKSPRLNCYFFTIDRDVSHNVFTKCIHFMLKWQVSKWTMKRDAL